VCARRTIVGVTSQFAVSSYIITYVSFLSVPVALFEKVVRLDSALIAARHGIVLS
jgi:hypothetical protein